jgi:LysR family transcriptional regulator, hca operon transcriptional activator
LVVVLPSDHPLTACETIALEQFIGETFIIVSHTAPTLRTVIEEFILQSGLDIRASYEVDNLAMAVSLVASTRGLALLPCYARNFLPGSVTSRPLAVEPPTIDLVIGYSRTNTSPILSLFLSRIDHLLSRCRSPATEDRASVE